MRSVQFSRRIELDFPGNIHTGALAFGDVDNDGGGELVVGNVDGQIAVFKGTAAQTVADDTLPSRSQRPWWTCRGLGSIAVVVVGDLMHTGLNATVGISAEGACHVFEESTARRRRLSDNTPSASALPSASPSVDASTDGSFGETTSVESRMVLAHTLSIPVNIKTAIIACLDPTIGNELFVGRTDRIVHAFRFEREGSLTQLRQTRMWNLKGQIGSLSVMRDDSGDTVVCVAQPAGAFVTYTKENHSRLCYSAAPSRSTATVGSTELIGGLRDPSQPDREYVAVATLDGSLKLSSLHVPIWALEVDYQLFAITKLDLMRNGSDTVVSCAWDGTTFIVDRSRNVVKFTFGQEVCAFGGGQFAVQGGLNQPCLAYVTFHDTIHLFYDITLHSVRTQTVGLPNVDPLSVRSALYGV